MKNSKIVILTVLLAVLSLSVLGDRTHRTPHNTLPSRQALLSSLTHLTFEENRGQMNKNFHYLARTPGFQLYLGRESAVMKLHSLKKETQENIEMTFQNASLSDPRGENQLLQKSHYLRGAPEKWVQNVPHFARVSYSEVYPGIDVAFYGKDGEAEFDFIVKPGANYQQIALSYDGIKNLSVTEEGHLALEMPSGARVLQKAPIVYQETDGVRTAINSHYELLSDHSVGFVVASYDTSKTLVIDPTIIYSTYWGRENNHAFTTDVAYDGSGNLYVIGHENNSDIFIAKLNSDGTSIVYSTYFGGERVDIGRSLAVGNDGSVYFTGSTNSTDFPVTTSAYDIDCGISATPNQCATTHAFVGKLNINGSSFDYATYLGETDDNSEGRAIAIDGDGNVYVAGFVDDSNTNGASNFPVTANAFQPDFAAGTRDGFISKLNSDGSALLTSTFIGSDSFDAFTNYDEIQSIVLRLDSANHLYYGATTNGVLDNWDDQPWMPASITTMGDLLTFYGNMVVVKMDINTSTNALTPTDFALIGYEGTEQLTGMQIYPDGSVIVAGSIRPVGGTSPDFESQGGFTLLGCNNSTAISCSSTNGLLVRFNFGSSTPVYSTLLGSSTPGNGGTTILSDVDLDTAGRIYVSGRTNITSGFHTGSSTVYSGQNFCFSLSGNDNCGFVMQLTAAGNSANYVTYFGNASSDFVDDDTTTTALAVDPAGNVYISGYTSNNTSNPSNPKEFTPLVNPVQPEHITNTYAGYLAKIIPADIIPPPPPGICGAGNPAADLETFRDDIVIGLINTAVPISFRFSNNGPDTAFNTTFDIDTSNLPPSTIRANLQINGSVPAGSSCTFGAEEVNCNFPGDLPIGNYSVQFDVTSDTLGAFFIPTEIDSSTCDPFIENNRGSRSLNIVSSLPEADLQVVAEIGTTEQRVGEPIEVILTITNNGPDSATNSSVVVTGIPQNVAVTDLRFEGISIDVDTDCTFSTSEGRLECRTGTVANGDSFRALFNVIASQEGSWQATVTVDSSETDPIPANNSDLEGLNILPLAQTTEEGVLQLVGGGCSLVR